MAAPSLIDRHPGRNRVTSIVTKNSSNATLHSRTYTFNLASEVTRIVEGTVTTEYTYDDAGQLETEVKSTGYSAAYSYDANGNRLTRTVNGVTENYSYDAGDKLTAIVGGADPRTFTYDGAGRTTGIVRSSGTTSFTYDYESRVTSITKPGMTTNSMAYNGLDTRVGMTDSSGARTFKRAGIGVTSPVLSDGSASFTPSGEWRGGVKTAYHGGLKSFDTQTNSAQAVVGQRLTDAFGNQISGSGVWKGRFAYGGPYGYQEDPDTGLRLLGHRYYDSSTGRFLTRDPIKDGRNWYVYCDSNPLTGVDANGLKIDLVVVGVKDDAEKADLEHQFWEAFYALYDWAVYTGNEELLKHLQELLYGRTVYTFKIMPGSRSTPLAPVRCWALMLRCARSLRLKPSCGRPCCALPACGSGCRA